MASELDNRSSDYNLTIERLHPQKKKKDLAGPRLSLSKI